MSAHNIRVLCESKDTAFSITDHITREPLFWWRGNDLRIEVALRDNGQYLTAASVGAINVVVKAIDAVADDAVAMIVTLGAGDCDGAFDGSQWEDGSSQLCVALWTRELAALDAGEYVLIVSHDDPSGKRNTYLHSRVVVREDQYDSVNLSAPPVPAANYYTSAESDGRYTPAAHELRTDNPHEVSADKIGVSQSVINEHNLMQLAAQFQPFGLGGGNHYVGITHWGDSMDDIPEQVSASLEAKYGIGAIMSDGLGRFPAGATWTLTGGAVKQWLEPQRNQPTSFPRLLGDNEITMPGGSTAQFTLLQSGKLYPTSTSNSGHARNFAIGEPYGDIKKVTFVYLKKLGGGDLALDVTQVSNTYATVNVSTSNATDLLATTDVTILHPLEDITVDVTASTAECTLIGCIFWRSEGIIFWSSGVGGSSMTLQENAYVAGEPNQVYKDLFALFYTKAIFHLQRAGAGEDPDLAAAYTTMMDAQASLGATVITLGEPPRGDGASDPLVRNALMKEECLTRSWPFFDLSKIAGGDMTLLTSLGWDGDNVHLDPEAHRFFAGAIMKSFERFNSLETSDNTPLTAETLHAGVLQRAVFEAARETRLTFGAHSIVDGVVDTGGFNQSSTNERGVRITQGAVTSGDELGFRVGNLCLGNAGIDTNIMSLAVGGIGYRNIDMKDGVRGMICFGGGTVTNAKIADITATAFGLEFATDTDVGLSLTSGQAVRMFAHNGTAMTYAPWRDLRFGGNSNPDSRGYNFVIIWDKVAGTLTHSAGPNSQSMNKLTSLSVPEFQSSKVAGQWVHSAMWCVTTQAAGGSQLEWCQLFSKGKTSSPYPYGLTK